MCCLKDILQIPHKVISLFFFNFYISLSKDIPAQDYSISKKCSSIGFICFNSLPYLIKTEISILKYITAIPKTYNGWSEESNETNTGK